MGLDLEACRPQWSAPLECISLIPCGSALSVIIVYAVNREAFGELLTVPWGQFIDI